MAVGDRGHLFKSKNLENSVFNEYIWQLYLDAGGKK